LQNVGHRLVQNGPRRHWKTADHNNGVLVNDGEVLRVSKAVHMATTRRDSKLVAKDLADPKARLSYEYTRNMVVWRTDGFEAHSHIARQSIQLGSSSL